MAGKAGTTSNHSILKNPVSISDFKACTVWQYVGMGHISFGPSLSSLQWLLLTEPHAAWHMPKMPTFANTQRLQKGIGKLTRHHGWLNGDLRAER